MNVSRNSARDAHPISITFDTSRHNLDLRRIVTVPAQEVPFIFFSRNGTDVSCAEKFNIVIIWLQGIEDYSLACSFQHARTHDKPQPHVYYTFHGTFCIRHVYVYGRCVPCMHVCMFATAVHRIWWSIVRPVGVPQKIRHFVRLVFRLVRANAAGGKGNNII